MSQLKSSSWPKWGSIIEADFNGTYSSLQYSCCGGVEKGIGLFTDDSNDAKDWCSVGRQGKQIEHENRCQGETGNWMCNFVVRKKVPIDLHASVLNTFLAGSRNVRINYGSLVIWNTYFQLVTRALASPAKCDFSERIRSCQNWIVFIYYHLCRHDWHGKAEIRILLVWMKKRV